MMTRKEKLEKLEAIYSKALKVMHDNLGKDKEQVYAASQAIQTASREIGVIQKVMTLVGELDRHGTPVLGWKELLKHRKEAEQVEA